MQGNIVGNDQTKYNFRAKLDQKAFNDKVTFGMNTFVTHTTNTGLNTGTNALSGNVAGAIYAFPNVPSIWPDGSYNLSADGASLGQGANTRPIYGNYTNQAYVLDKNIYKNQQLNLTGNAFVDVEIVKGLNAKSYIGINYLNGEDYLYYDPGHGDGKNVNGRIYQYNLPSFRYNWQNTISYNNNFGAHKIGFVGGHETQKTRSRYFFAHGTNLSNSYFGSNENIISNTLTNQFIGGTASERAFQSFFGRANYSLLDRYLISVTVRHDLISSLPHDNQGATLPGISLGWRISEEGFFKNSPALGFVSELKLRGGWAKVGNVEIGNYPYAGTFGAAQYGDLSGIRFNQAGNNLLGFETSKKLNFGLDLSLWANKLSFSAEYFRNDIDNLILQSPTPPSLGVPGNTIAQNIGKMYNKGWEFSINSTNIQTENFSWRTNANVSFVQNKVQRLVANTPINSTYNTTREGESIGSFFGYEYYGVNAANGNPIYEKANGTYVQQVTAANRWAVYDPANPSNDSEAGEALTFADKRILGRSNPTWYGGLNNQVSFKNFDFTLFLTFSGGNKIYNVTRQEQLNNQLFANAGRELLDRWTTPGQVTEVPRLYFNSDARANQIGNATSRFLENGNFIRAQNISLGYTIPAFIKNKIKATNLRIYAQVQNAFIITKYKGLDPELGFVSASATANADNNNQTGLDNRTNPVPRVFTVGLNLGF